MRRAAVALRELLGRIASGIGVEGAFLTAGTLGLAYVASYIHPLGGIVVVSVMSMFVGLALAVPPRNPQRPQ